MAAPYNAYITVSYKSLLYIGIKPKRAFTSHSCHILDVKLLETSGENPGEGPSGERSKKLKVKFSDSSSSCRIFIHICRSIGWSYGTNFHTKFHSFVALSFQAYYCYH